MSKLTPTLSRVLKPYHTHELHYEESLPALDGQGYLTFAPGDVESPRNWSNARRWWISFASVVAVINATFASSAPSGILQVCTLPSEAQNDWTGLTDRPMRPGYIYRVRCDEANRRTDHHTLSPGLLCGPHGLRTSE